MDRRGAEMSINAIIVAILALLVLVVLAFVFKDQIGKSSEQYSGISEKTGSCIGDIGNPDNKDCENFIPKKSSYAKRHTPSVSYRFGIK